MNDKNDMTSQPGPGTTLRGEPTPPASRFTTSLLLQSSGGAKAIFSNLKDLLTMRAPQFAHSSPASRTITLKDENFSRSQIASFALHSGFALLLFMTFVASRPVVKKISHDGFDSIIAPNARWSCNNLILFTDQFALDDLEVIESSQVNWTEWRKKWK